MPSVGEGIDKVITEITGSIQQAQKEADEALGINRNDDGSLANNNEYDPDLIDMILYQPNKYVTDDGKFARTMDDVIGIFGLPYQYMPHVDPRISTDLGFAGIGADYANNIVAGMPLLFISPGKPAFMAGYSKGQRRNVLEQLIAAGGQGAQISDLVNETGKFYTFEYDVPGFYRVVNPMCRITARLLQVQDHKLDGKPCDEVNWMNYTLGKIKGIADFTNDYMSIPFYIDTDTQVSDSFSNSVTDTSLASTVDSFSDMGRELMFYLGYTPAVLGLDDLSQSLLDNVENLKQQINSMTSSSIFGTLINQITSVATGGRLIFPKIWSNSDFSRSYNVNIKLRSPDLDNFSLWINIIVPLCHILGLVCPRMVDENVNALTSPPLVRSMYKGFFNVDMGMITNADITKGDDAQWSANGIPTSVDVSLTITDMYDAMSLTPTSSGLAAGGWFKFDTLDNTAEMDYLMNMCGINIYKPEIGRMLDLFYVNRLINRAGDIPTEIFTDLRQGISGAINNIYRGFH